MRGESGLGPLRVTWEVPDERREAAGGLEHLPASAPDAVACVPWTIVVGAAGAAPAREDAFYGAARLTIDEGSSRVWAPGAELDVSPSGVQGRVEGSAGLAGAVALHVLAAYAGVVHVHAALVRIAGRSVLVAGGSGAGKTSAALGVAAGGGEILSDDVAYVDARLVAWPVARPAHVADRTLSAHPRLVPIGRVAEGGSKAIVAVARTPAAPAPVDAVVIAALGAGPTRVEGGDGAATFAALLGSSALAVVPRAPRRDELLDRLVALAERPRARLIAGEDALEDPARIARALEAWLAR